MEILIFAIPAGLATIWWWFVVFMNAKARIYEYGEHTIRVYAGWKDHYIMVDGQVVDRVEKLMYYKITLNAEVNGAKITAVICSLGLTGNTIKTFINGEKAVPIKKSGKSSISA